MTASHYYKHDYTFIYMCIYIANYQKPFSNYYRVIIIRTGTWMALKLLVLLHEEKNYQIFIINMLVSLSYIGWTACNCFSCNLPIYTINLTIHGI